LLFCHLAASSASITSSASRKPSLPQGNEDMPTYKEVFVAPKLSLVACLMKKPVLPTEKVSYDYDSSASDAVISKNKISLFQLRELFKMYIFSDLG
jgi:hypothetical protein